MKKSMDYTEYGGAPLLGIDGIVLKGHRFFQRQGNGVNGSSAVRMIDADIVGVIKSRLSQADGE